MTVVVTYIFYQLLYSIVFLYFFYIYFLRTLEQIDSDQAPPRCRQNKIDTRRSRVQIWASTTELRLL